jgi:Zn-dependent peptidase ImmA (M78 family)
VTELRRGFKTEANDIAREIRGELGLRDIEPLDPWKLAAALEIQVVPLSSFRLDAPRAHRLFRVIDLKTFSAVTVWNGTERMIVYNDAHSRGRQASDITHELAHALLQHTPAPALDHRGCRYWDPELEKEADWLAGVLLISEDAALTIVRSGWSLEDAASRYGVSTPMIRFRVNMTGARRRVGGPHSRWKGLRAK